MPDHSVNSSEILGPIISVQNLGKQYTIWRDPSARLKHPFFSALGSMFPWLRPRIRRRLSGLCSYFQALNGITLEIGRGESVGLIGKNGSGKSTFLQMVAGTLTPTTGEVAVHGRVGALLELGSGFNPDFSGRENVLLSASLYGLNPGEIESRFEKIVEFSEIASFIDQPVKTYSSGMMMRLAFAVTTQIQADLLIVDEALSVGDARFQKKCFSFFKKFVQDGGTLLFVTHDTGTVIDVCNRALLLHEGKLVADGEPLLVSRKYHQLLYDTPGEESQEEQDPPTNEAVRYGDKRLEVTGLVLTQSGIVTEGPLEVGEPWEVEILVRCNQETNSPAAFGLLLTNKRGQEIYGTSSRDHGCSIPQARPGQEFRCRFAFPGSLVPGDYFLSPALAPLNPDTEEDNFHDFVFDQFHFRVAGLPRCFTSCLVDLGAKVSLA